MQIAYVTETYPPEINGVSLTAERAVQHLRSAGHRVQIVRPRQQGERARDDEREWRTAAVPIPLYPGVQCGWAATGALQRRWRRCGTHVVHVATPGPLARAALRSAELLGMPATVDFRTSFSAYSHHGGFGAQLSFVEPLVLRYLHSLHRLADCTFVPTVEMAGRLTKHGFERLELLGRGVDSQQFSPSHRDASLRAEWGAREDDAVMLYVGRLAAEKNVALALQTFERLQRQQPRLKMIVVGDGPLRPVLEQAHPRVRFVGERRGDELSRHYASADVFLFPSLTETFGNVTLEAMASGLAVVAFDTAAARAHAVHGRSATLIPLPGPEASAPPVAESFFAACTWALLAATPGSQLRRAAREAALAAPWERVLRAFEAHLHIAAASTHRHVGHVAVA